MFWIIEFLSFVIRRCEYYVQQVKNRHDFSKFQSFGTNSLIEGAHHITSHCNISLGDEVYIGPRSYIAGDGGLTIGNSVMIGPMVYIQTSSHNFESPDLQAVPYDHRIIRGAIIIEDYAWIGGRVTILPGVTIGMGAVVGAGSVVTKNIPPMAIAVGNPAHPIRYRDPAIFTKLAEQKITHRSWVEDLNHPIEWMDSDQVLK